jgi:hypothetical protein
MAKLIDLATKNLKKTDDQKALEGLKEAVEDNEMSFANDLHNAKKAVKLAEKRNDALAADPTASSSTIIAAQRELALANKNVADITAIIAARF